MDIRMESKLSRSKRSSESHNPEAETPEEVTEADVSADESKKSAVVSMPEAGGVAMAAILHLLRLVSAELVLLRGIDLKRFEEAARNKLNEFTSPTTNPKARQAGLAFAHELLEQILVQIRAQAELKKLLGSHKTESTSPPP